MNNIMTETTKKALYLFIILNITWLGLDLQGQVYPLSENSWDNPEFVERFMGTYGFETKIEPTINDDESRLFDELSALLQAQNRSGAIDLMRNNLTPESSAALDYTLGSLYLQNGNYSLAVDNYKRAVKKFPNFMRAYKNLGLALLLEQNYEQAITMIVKAIELGDGDGNAYGLLGYCYLNMGAYTSALDAYRLAHVHKPDNTDWSVGKAYALMQTGKFEEAIAKFRELLHQDPSNKSYYSSLVNAALSLQDEKAASCYLEIIRRMDNADGTMLFLLGDIYINQDLPHLAMDVYTEAFKKSKNVKPDRAIRGVKALISRGDYKDAGILIKKSYAYYGTKLPDSKRLELLNLEAQLNLVAGDDHKAAKTLEKVIEADPMNGDTLLLLGNYYFGRKDYETAQFYFERAENIMGVAADAFVDHARLMVALKNYGHAVALLERAQGINKRTNVGRYLEAVQQAHEASQSN